MQLTELIDEFEVISGAVDLLRRIDRQIRQSQTGAHRGMFVVGQVPYILGVGVHPAELPVARTHGPLEATVPVQGPWLMIPLFMISAGFMIRSSFMITFQHRATVTMAPRRRLCPSRSR